MPACDDVTSLLLYNGLRFSCQSAEVGSLVGDATHISGYALVIWLGLTEDHPSTKLTYGIRVFHCGYHTFAYCQFLATEVTGHYYR